MAISVLSFVRRLSIPVVFRCLLTIARQNGKSQGSQVANNPAVSFDVNTEWLVTHFSHNLSNFEHPRTSHRVM
jgi:hypothetical protein